MGARGQGGSGQGEGRGGFRAGWGFRIGWHPLRVVGQRRVGGEVAEAQVSNILLSIAITHTSETN